LLFIYQGEVMIRITQKSIEKSAVSEEEVEGRFLALIKGCDQDFKKSLFYFLKNNFQLLGHRLLREKEISKSNFRKRIMVIYTALGPLQYWLKDDMPDQNMETLKLWLETLLLTKIRSPENLEKTFESLALYSQEWSESIIRQVKDLADKDWSYIITLAVILCYLYTIPENIQVQNPEVFQMDFFPKEILDL